MAEEISNEIPKPVQAICLEISASLHESLRLILNSSALSETATLPSAFADFKQLVKEILNAPTAYPAWRVDDLEEQLASSRRVADRLAGADTPNRNRGDTISDLTVYEGNRDTLKRFIAQLRLNSSVTRLAFRPPQFEWYTPSTGCRVVRRLKFSLSLREKPSS
jgi:hypothetical protein